VEWVSCREINWDAAHMRYFNYLAEQAFKTAPNGERLFFPSGPRFRPYIMPDAETERRISRKLVWQLQIMLGVVILGLPLLTAWHIVQKPVYFIGVLVVVTAAFMLARKLTLASDLRGLRRTDRPLPVKDFFGEMARKHSFGGLCLGFATSLAFVAIGVGMALLGQAGTVGLICAAFFALCGLGWGYALWLKPWR
jgi:hypothetical protein